MGWSRRAVAAVFAILTVAALLPTPGLAQGKVTVGVALAQDDNPFYIAMLRGIRARAQELGWQVIAVSSNEDKLKQINGVQESVARGSASPNQTLHVAMDEKQIGRDIAEWTAKKIGGAGKIAMLLGPAGAP